MDNLKYPNRKILHLLTAPFLWIVFPSLLLLDILLEIYHNICFPVYNLEKVKRSKYIKIDRHKLEYLNLFQKIGCIYCGYANGLLNYSVNIAGQTEKYWCGIKHKESKNFVVPKHHKDFIEYGDEKLFNKGKKK
jgi:hypothetical protein